MMNFRRSCNPSTATLSRGGNSLSLSLPVNKLSRRLLESNKNAITRLVLVKGLSLHLSLFRPSWACGGVVEVRMRMRMWLPSSGLQFDSLHQRVNRRIKKYSRSTFAACKMRQVIKKLKQQQQQPTHEKVLGKKVQGRVENERKIIKAQKRQRKRREKELKSCVNEMR